MNARVGPRRATARAASARSPLCAPALSPRLSRRLLHGACWHSGSRSGWRSCTDCRTPGYVGLINRCAPPLGWRSLDWAACARWPSAAAARAGTSPAEVTTQQSKTPSTSARNAAMRPRCSRCLQLVVAAVPGAVITSVRVGAGDRRMRPRVLVHPFASILCMRAPPPGQPCGPSPPPPAAHRAACRPGLRLSRIRSARWSSIMGAQPSTPIKARALRGGTACALGVSSARASSHA